MKFTAIAAVVMTTAIASTSAPATAQGNPHLGHVATQWRDTPDNAGFLATARMEADIAAQHAELAARDLENLASMKRHIGHVLNALDPSVQAAGPGKGYGLVKAIRGVGTHIKLAAETEGASDNIKRHATHVGASSGDVEQWSLAVIEKGKQVMATEDAHAAAALVQEIHTMTQHILNGFDANGDGTIGWQQGEGGLAQAEQHMHLMMQGENSSQ